MKTNTAIKPSTPWRYLSLLAFFFSALGACSPFLSVYSEEEKGVNLNQYYSYAWQENLPSTAGEPVPYPLSSRVQDKIRETTDAQMRQYGFRQYDANPQLLIHYHVIVANHVYFQPGSDCNGAEGLHGGIHCHRIEPVHYREGSLMIDFMDAATSRRVWRGVATDVIDNTNTPEQWDAEIDQAIRQIFKKLPVRPTLASSANAH